MVEKFITPGPNVVTTFGNGIASIGRTLPSCALSSEAGNVMLDASTPLKASEMMLNCSSGNPRRS